MAFMGSPEYIYNKMQLSGNVANWSRHDWFTIFARLSAQGFVWDVEDGRLRQKGFYGLVAQTPWCHTLSSPTKHCTLDHNIIYNNWRFITPRCLECWKVVVPPKNFDELMKLEALENQLGYDSKCGIELRDYTPRHYGGYFYNDSLDQGREKYKIVKDAVAEALSPETAEKVILKRGCTEFEMGSGPSLHWNITPENEKLFEIIESFVDVPRAHGEQSIQLKTNVHMKWVLWAHSNGDMSYVPYNGGIKLFPGYVPYHEGNIADIKHDLAVARAQAAVGIPSETSDKFIEVVRDFAKEYKITNYGELVRSLGANFSNPLDMKFRIVQDVPEEVKGDLDETT